MMAGGLKRRITLQQHGAGADAFGEPLTGWTDVATVWAGIEDLTGNQYIAAQSAQNPIQAKITIRYRAGISPAMRVVHGSDIYDIEAVLGQDKRTLELLCKRGVSNG